MPDTLKPMARSSLAKLPICRLLGFGAGAFIAGPLGGWIGGSLGSAVEYVFDEEGLNLGSSIGGIFGNLFAGEIQPLLNSAKADYNHDLRRAMTEAVAICLAPNGPVHQTLLSSLHRRSFSASQKQELKNLLATWQQRFLSALKEADRLRDGTPLNALFRAVASDTELLSLTGAEEDEAAITRQLWTAFYQHNLAPTLEGNTSLPARDNLESETVASFHECFPAAFDGLLKQESHRPAWIAYQTTLLRLFRQQLQDSLPALEAKLDALLEKLPSEPISFDQCLPYLQSIKADTSYTRQHGATKEDIERLRADLAKPAPTPQSTRYALPAKPYCIHRGGDLKKLTEALTAPGSPIAVLGPPGVGKSTVTLAALHQPEVIARYGAHRAWVRCDAVSSEELLRQAIAQAIGLTAKAEWSDLRAALTTQDSLVALDNFETPWRGDSTAVEERLADLSTWPGVQWLLSIRGAEAPTEAERQTSVHPFTDPDAARELFRHHAPGLLADDADLDALLSQMDGLPLAIVLLANQAKLTGDLPLLKKRWEEERSTLLRSGTASSRLTSLDVSLCLSTAALPPDAIPLLRLLGILPAGLAPVDLKALLGSEGYRHAATLVSHGLLYTDAGRLRQLAPIREHVAREHPPAAEERKPWDEHYLNLVSTLASKAGEIGGVEAMIRLIPEVANIEPLLLHLLETCPIDSNTLAIKAASNWGEMVTMCGGGSIKPTAVAARKAAQSGKIEPQAQCTFRLGRFSLSRGRPAEADSYFREAFDLYVLAESKLGRANCIKSFGDIALNSGNHEKASDLYQEAQHLYSEIPDFQSQANCIHSLGEIALSLNDRDKASRLFIQGQSLSLKINYVLGQANCILGRGDIALLHNKFEEASTRFLEALPLFEEVGVPLCQANCIVGLGNIALRRGKHVEANRYFLKALTIYRQVDSLHGQANCYLYLGEAAKIAGHLYEARQLWNTALVMTEQIGDPYGRIKTHWHLAKCAENKEAQQAHVRAVRQCFSAIERPDLQAELDREFGLEE